MARKMSATLGTEIYVNTLKASSSIKDFNKVLENTKAEWKALSSAEKFAGNSLGSLKTKYDGLGKEINLTKDKITKLKAEQAKLNDSNTGAIKKYNEYGAQIKKLQEQQGKLDTSTKEGRDSYDKLAKKIDETRQAQSKNTGVTEKDAKAYMGLEKQINTAKNQITGYQKQQEKTANSMKYYTSGLEKLQKDHKLATASSKAYVDRLQAEGKTTEANKAKMTGLKDSLSNLSKQYDKQENELKQIAKASGKASDAYKEQKIRLDKTGTSVANTKGDISKLQSTINKTSGNPFKRLTEKIKGTNKEASKSHSIFKSVFSANIASNAISSAWTAISSKMGDAISVGNEYLEQQDKMSAQWKTLTGSVKGSKEMTSAINDLATSAQNSAEMVNGLASQFYAVDKNKDHVINLSKATLTLQDAFGATDDEIQNFGKQWSQMMANGKVSAQDFMSFTNVFPALKPALLDYEKDVTHNSKLTMKQLNDMISQGKISSETMNKVLTETAKKNSKATENFGKTIPGMTRTITSTMPRLLGAIEKPFYKMKNPLVGSISKWVTDKNTTKEFNKLGKALTGTINDFTSAFGGSKLDAGKLLDKVLKGLTNSIKELGKWASKHKGTIKDFFSNFKEKSADTIKILASTMSTLAKVTSPLIKLMAKHPKVAGTFLAGFMIAGKLKGTVSGMIELAKGIKKVAEAEKVQAVAQKIMNLAMDANPVMLIVTAIGALVVGLVELYKHNKKFKKFVDGIGKAISKTFGAIVKFFKNNWKEVGLYLVNPIAGAVNSLYKHNPKFRKWADSLLKSIKGVFKGIGKWFSGIWNSVAKGAKAGWNGIKTAVSFGAKAVKVVALAPIVVLASMIASIWNRIKKPTMAVWGWMKSFIGGVAKAVKTVVTLYFNTLKKAVTTIWNAVKRVTMAVWNPIKNFVINIAKSIKNNVTKWFNALKSAVTSIWNAVKSITSKIWNPIKNFIIRTANAIKSGVSKVFTAMKNVITGIWNKVSGTTRNVWNGIHKWVTGKANSIKNGVVKPFNQLKDALGNILDKISSKWHKIWNGMKDFFGDIWKKIKGSAKGGINGVIGWLNGGIGGINKVIHTFGGSKSAIGKIPKLAKGGKVKKGLAMVNDGKGEEAIIKHGKAFKVKGKNALVNFEGDETVIPYEASRAMFGESIAHYAKGSKGWLSEAGSWFKDKWDGLTNFIKHPLKALDGIMNKAVSKISGSELVTKLTPALGHGFTKGITTAFKKLLDKLHKKHEEEDGGGQFGNVGGTGVKRWEGLLKKALKQNGLPDSGAYVRAWLSQINTESSGNPKAVQGYIPGDPNNGNPARGLLQTIPSTFSAHAFKGHHNIFNGYDNMLSAIAYAKGRYGKTGMLQVIGHGHGYANGGIVNSHGLYEVAENNQPEAIIPLSKMKRAQATKVLDDVRERFSDGSDSHNSHDKELEEQIQNLTDVVSGMKDLVAMILNVNSNTLQATKDGAFDKTKMYQQTANDINLANYQAH